MYQDDRQLAWGNINIFQNQLFIAAGGLIHRPMGYGPSTLPLRHSA